MPRLLFEGAAVGQAGRSFARRRGVSLPASMAIHAVVLIVFMAAPLFAPLRAPAFPSVLAPFVVSMAAVPEIVVPRPRPPVAVEAAQAAAGAAPLVAPEGIQRETGIEVAAVALAELTRDATGLVVGVATGLPPAPAPPAPPPPEEPVHVGGQIRTPERVAYVAPVYPPVAQAARLEGIVITEATISSSGSVVNARVLRSSPLLDEAALAAVRQWRYTPTLLNGVPVPVIMTVTVQFTIKD